MRRILCEKFTLGLVNTILYTRGITELKNDTNFSINVTLFTIFIHYFKMNIDLIH